jgi:hypothetical protein
MKTISKNQAGVKVTAGVKAGGFVGAGNHNRRGLAVKTSVKAGGSIICANHNRCLA